MAKLRKKVMLTIAFVIAGLYIVYSYRCCLVFLAGSAVGSPDSKYFGAKTYSELLLPCTVYDRLLLTPCLSELDSAFSAIEPNTGDEEQEAEWGALAKYVSDRPNTVSEEHRISFLTGRINGRNAYIWFEYISAAYDENGDTVCASGSLVEPVLVRAEFRYENGGWRAVSVKEHP